MEIVFISGKLLEDVTVIAPLYYAVGMDASQIMVKHADQGPARVAESPFWIYTVTMIVIMVSGTSSSASRFPLLQIHDTGTVFTGRIS